jgi:hypothetical protein
MFVTTGTATASSGEYLLALAQGLSGLLGITSAVLIFVVDRQVRRFRVHDRALNTNLMVLVVVSAFTILLAALTWWAWASTAPDISLLFCWSPEVWLGIIFGGITLAASAGLVFGLVTLIRSYRKGRDDGWEP